MTLRLNGSTSGFTQIDAAAVAGDNSITLPTLSGSIILKDSSGNTEVGTGVTFNNPSANVFAISNSGGDRLRITSDGKILAGHTADISGGGLQVSGSANAGNAGFHRFDANDSGPFIQLLKSRNETVGGNTAVQAGDELGTINFQGADGADYHSGARIVAKVDGEVGTGGDTTDMPGRLEFHTTVNGSGTPTEKVRITNAGHLSIVGDDQKLLIGAGDDLQLYHDASHSYIEEAGTGALKLKGNDIRIENTSSRNVFKAVGTACELYFDNGSSSAKKFETTSSGATVTGNLTISNGAIYLPQEIAHYGDTNTNITFPADDTIQLDTAGSARIHIKSDGLIGINNNAPLYAMHLKNAMASSPSFIHMEVTGDNTVGGGGGIAFDTSASSNVSNNSLYLATIKGIRNSADDGSNDLVFSTSKSNVAGDDGNTHSPKEKMRITSDGKLILSGTARTTPFISGDGGMCIEQSYDGNLRALTIRNKDTDAAAATSMCFSLNRSGGDQDFTAGEIKLVKEQAWTTTSSTVDGAMVFSTILDGTMAEKVRITAAGQLNVGSGSFVVESDGDISTNLRCHGHIELDSTGSFSSPKIKLHSVGGSGEFAGNILPFIDAGFTGHSDLGSSSKRFEDAYVRDGVTTGSDRNYKSNIRELLDAERSVAVSCKSLLRAWKWKDAVSAKSDAARTHIGIVAQDLEQAFTDQGLDAHNYAMFCEDTWYEVDGKQEDSEGNKYTVDSEGAVAVTRLSIRYHELLAFIIAAL